MDKLTLIDKIFRFRAAGHIIREVSPSPSATSSANVRVEVKTRDPIDQVVNFLEQILDVFKRII